MQIGVDLGGHTMKAALVEEGRIVTSAVEKTPATRMPGEVLERISWMVRRLARNVDVEGVGIGVPGMLDAGRERVLRLPNFPQWKGFELKAECSRISGFPVLIENDANCYALGEGVSGAARGLENYIVFTVGTGIGGGVVLSGALLRGSHGMAGELGHAAVVKPIRCGCGGLGHSESIAGADGIEKAFAALGIHEDLALLWKRRDHAPYRQVWMDALDALARTIATAVHFFDPQAVVVGGGLSRGEGFVDELQNAVAEYLATPFRQSFELRPSLLGNDAAVIGAALLGAGGAFRFPCVKDSSSS